MLAFTYLRENDFQKAQKYLLEMTCYFFLEERIKSAGSIGDLKRFAEEELTVFHSFIKPFNDFFKKYAEPLIKMGVILRERPFMIRRDPSSVRGQTKYADYEYVESIKEKGFQPFGKGDSREEASVDYEGDSGQEMLGDYEGEEYEGIEDEENLRFEEIEGSEYKPVDQVLRERARGFAGSHEGRKTREKKEGEEEDEAIIDPFKYEKEGFFYEMLEVLMEKWKMGLVSQYELQGNPLSVISFLEGIFNKIGLSIMDKDYDEKLKRTEGISLSTKKRDEKEKKEGKIDKDLSSGEIRLKKEYDKKHHVEGYWTLNQLIKELVDRGQGTRTTLMRKIRKLMEANKIQLHKEEGIYRFVASEETLDKIIEEISKL